MIDSLHLSDTTAPAAAAVASAGKLSNEKIYHPQPKNENILLTARPSVVVEKAAQESEGYLRRRCEARYHKRSSLRLTAYKTETHHCYANLPLSLLPSTEQEMSSRPTAHLI